MTTRTRLTEKKEGVGTAGVILDFLHGGQCVQMLHGRPCDQEEQSLGCDRQPASHKSTLREAGPNFKNTVQLERSDRMI